MTLVSHFLLVFNSSSNIAIYCLKDEKFRKVLLGLLGWQRQGSGGGGRLRGGETSNMHRDLTITTFAPWEPGASTPVPAASSNREEGKAVAETGFISHVSCGISTIPPTSSPDQIN